MMSEDLLQPGHVVKDRWKVVSHCISKITTVLINFSIFLIYFFLNIFIIYFDLQ